ncbi:ABC transporter permease [Glycomyces sp. A-F 0318]|uniref:FtsX-like permease family protein n=1 Tax=Glycomyces amatae TaxID=2881355 RepID=UPI001E3FBE7E|nr:ABC transporter permease [Glycomyces amatae]MCD0445108.1 ABC transporter permease [Glycomyces amatae]
MPLNTGRSNDTRRREPGDADLRVGSVGSLTALAARLAWGQRRRHALTFCAAVVGIAFVAGTLIFTDGVRAAIEERSQARYAATDAAVRPADGESPLDPGLVDRVAAAPGVAAASGRIQAGGELTGPDGETLPGMVLAVPAEVPLRSFDLLEGAHPAASGDALVDPGTAERLGLAVGDAFTAESGAGEPTTLRLTGIARTEGTPYDANRLAAVLPETALALAGADGYSEIIAAAEPGTDAAGLAAALGAELGAGVTVLTGGELVAEERERAFQNVDLILQVLNVFVLIAIVTAAFVIANGFSITLAQRTRQLATLRLIGLTRGQLSRLALAEAALMGLAASLLGLAAGAAIARGLSAVLASSGTPTELGAIGARTAAITLAVGIIVTVASAYLPARKAARTAAIQALRESATAAGTGAGRARLALGATALAAAAALWALALDAGLIALLLSGVLGFTGTVLVLPALVPAFAWLVDRMPLGRTPVRLAVRQVARNRRRAAGAAAAIVLCTALVSAVLIGTHSARTSVEHEAAREYPADFSLSGGALPDALLDDLRALPALDAVHARRTGEVDGLTVTSTDPAIAARAGLDLRFDTGPSVAVAAPAAAEHGWAVGDTIAVGDTAVTVADVFPVGDDPAPLAGFDLLTDEAGAAAILPETPVSTIEVLAPRTAGADVAAVAAAYPGVSVNDLIAYRDSRTAGIDLVLRAMLALLALSMLISAVGLANMLSLSMYERIREHGTLRALGTTRGGLRAMVTTESVLVTVLGAAVGLALGFAGAYGAIAVVAAEQPVALAVPYGHLAALVAATMAAAVLAALVPASKAARANIIANLRTE